MRIYNETLYDKDMIIRYNKYYLIDFFKRNFSIIAIGALVAAAYSFAVAEWETAVLILALIVVYAILTVVIQKTTQKRALKRSPIVETPIIRTYLFEDDAITIDGRFVHPRSASDGEGGPKRRTLSYDEVVRVQVFKEFYVIYDVSRRTYLVELNAFESLEQLPELRAFLTAKLGRRFR